MLRSRASEDSLPVCCQKWLGPSSSTRIRELVLTLRHRRRIHRKQARLDRHHEEHRRVLRLQGHPLQCHCCWCDGYQYFPISRTVGSQHGGPGNVDETLYDNASCLIFWSYSQVLTHVLDPGMKGEDFVEVSKVAEIALFLCSDAAQVVNGAVWTADGGVTAH